MNYGFLLHKPEAFSLLSYLSDSRPLYLLQMHGLALGHSLAVLYLPFAIYDLIDRSVAGALRMKPKPLSKIGNVTLGGQEPAFILGPCVIESEKFVWRMAQTIAEICAAETRAVHLQGFV